MKADIRHIRRFLPAAAAILILLTLYACREARNGRIQPPSGDVVSSADSLADDSVCVELPDELFVSESFTSGNGDAVLTCTVSDIIACSGGNMTALAVGTAKVKCGESEQLVTVTDDISERLGSVIERICVENASDDSMSELIRLRERLSACSCDEASQALAFVRALDAYSVDGGDISALADMLPDGALPADTDRTAYAPQLRYAAECIYAREQLAQSDAVLTFTGDCTFGRFNEQNADFQFPNVYENSGSVSYPFDGVRHWFELDDMTIINFEGTLTEYRKHAEKEFYFRGKKEYAKILPASSVEVACMANNHVYDYREEGFTDTVEALTEEAVLVSSERKPVIQKLNGIEIVIIADGPMLCTSQRLECSEYLREDVKKYKRDDNIVIVCPHWGVEYDTAPSLWEIELAHELIDLGADAIIGHHPHVIQGIEEYNGKPIAYSLGNFAFGGNYSVNNPQTFMLRLMLSSGDDGNRISGWTIVPCRVSGNASYNDYRPVTLTGQEAEDMVALLLKRSARLDGGIKAVRYMK